MNTYQITSSSLAQSFSKDVKRATEILRAYSPRRILLYGSVARGDYHADSDIDICVEGLDSNYFFAAIAKCMMAIDRPISIIDFNNTYGYFQERILREGKVLYEKN